MTILGAPLLLAKGGAHAGVHVEHDAPHRATSMNTIDPAPRHVGERGQAVRGDGVAGHDQQLDPVGREVARREQRVARHDLARPRPVRNPRRISEVDGVFVRQPADQRTQNGEPAHPAVEHADGRFSVSPHAAQISRQAFGRDIDRSGERRLELRRLRLVRVVEELVPPRALDGEAVLAVGDVDDLQFGDRTAEAQVA